MIRRRAGALDWYDRIVLGLVMVILLAISSKFLFDPLRASGERGIAISTGFGLTVTRIGFGAFPLAAAIVVVLCLLTRRFRSGLAFVVVLFGTVLVVRVVAAVVDHSLHENVPLIIPEVVFILLATVGLMLGRSPNLSTAAHAPDGRS